MGFGPRSFIAAGRGWFWFGISTTTITTTAIITTAMGVGITTDARLPRRVSQLSQESQGTAVRKGGR
jgi:hypothetical protein